MRMNTKLSKSYTFANAEESLVLSSGSKKFPLDDLEMFIFFLPLLF